MSKYYTDIKEGETLVIITPEGKEVILTLTEIVPWLFKEKTRYNAKLGFEDRHKLTVYRKELWLKIQRGQPKNDKN